MARQRLLDQRGPVDREGDSQPGVAVLKTKVVPLPIQRQVGPRGLRVLDDLEARICFQLLELIQRRAVHAVNISPNKGLQAVALVRDREPLDPVYEGGTVVVEVIRRRSRVSTPALSYDTLWRPTYQAERSGAV